MSEYARARRRSGLVAVIAFMTLALIGTVALVTPEAHARRNFAAIDCTRKPNHPSCRTPAPPTPTPTATPTVAPTPTPTLAPTPTPTIAPTPTPGGTWFGLPDPWAGVPFGSRPDCPSTAPNGLWIGGDKGGAVVLENCTFRDKPAGVNVLVLDNLRNAVIRDVDFDTVPEGIYANGGANVTIQRIRARNIFGPFTRTGFHSGNLVQWKDAGVVNPDGARQLVGGIRIHDLKLVQPATVPAGYTAYGTEDIISLGGAPGTWGDVIVERFAFDGGAWQSHSGTGLFLGDGASGHDITVRDGILVNPGQCAIGTGEEGPYVVQNLNVWSDKAETNAAMQVRTPRFSATNLRIDWPGGNIGNAGVAADFPRPEIRL